MRTLAPPSELMEDDTSLQEGYGLVINGEALGYALKRKYEKLFLEVGSACSVSFNRFSQNKCLGRNLLSCYTSPKSTSCRFGKAAQKSRNVIDW